MWGHCPAFSLNTKTQVWLFVSPGFSLDFSSFSYSELIKITGNFDDRHVSDGGCRLGEGGFGTVYKGVLNNKPVAVKKLSPVSHLLHTIRLVLLLLYDCLNHKNPPPRYSLLQMDDISMDELRVQFDQEVQTLKLYGFIPFFCSKQHSVSSNIYERTQTSCVWSRPLNQSKWCVHTDSSPLCKHVCL